ncbi:MAG: precorrin-6B methylase, partial [Lachnospiraceae bacterium]|nr:precorrin-6B methylase [Lachnospiraceae bacterium]
MEKQIFTNEIILSWLQYYSQNTPIDLEHVKIIDITKKNKNVIPTVEAHKTTLVFTNAGIDDIFYRLWNAGLGECEVWYNEGSDPSGEILHNQIKDMINRGINASAGMLIINPNARNSSRIGLSNEKLQRGSIHYVGSEIRSIILSKMMVDPQDDICVIGGESIAIEAALIAAEGSVIAVEYSRADRSTLEDNVSHFDLHNIKIIDHVDEKTVAEYRV